MGRIGCNALFASCILVVVVALNGCGYDTTTTADGTVVTERQSGKVYRVYDSVVLELPRVPLAEQTTGRVVERDAEIAGGAFRVNARVKLLSTTVLWNLTIKPAHTSADDGARHETDLRRLIALQRSSGNSVTLDLRDEAGFLVLPVEIPLNVAATRMLDDEGETSGFMYEGSEALGFDAIRVVTLLDFRWRF